MHSFKTYNDWCVCDAFGTKIVAHPDGCPYGDVSHLTPKRGKDRVGKAAAAWLEAHEKEAAAFRAWLSERREAAAKWKHETPHSRYSCDRGALAVRVNGARVLVGNGVGDGNFPVYAIESSGVHNADREAPDVLPPSFRPSGLSVDDCTLEILDYDCDGANVLVSLDVSFAMFYTDGEGAVVVTYSRKGA